MGLRLSLGGFESQRNQGNLPRPITESPAMEEPRTSPATLSRQAQLPLMNSYGQSQIAARIRSGHIGEEALRPGEVFIPWGKFGLGLMIPTAIAGCKELSPGAKLAWGALARRAGENGACFPGYKTLARDLAVSTEQVKRYLRRLRRIGLIRSERRGHRSNLYYFLWHPILEQTEHQDGPNGSEATSAHGSKNDPCQWVRNAPHKDKG